MSKQIIVKKLIDEIESLSATNIELIGNIFLENYTGKTFLHHGTDRNGRPVGHTVDSLSTDSTYIAEYSTEKDYFSGKTSFSKIEHDIEHAKTFVGSATLHKIFLICSLSEKTSFRENFEQTKLFQQNQDCLEIWGATDLADKIFDISISNTCFKNKIIQYLPDFKREIDAYADYGNTPYELDKHYIRNNEFLNIIDTRLNKEQICVITGVSGSGKTELAMDYFNQRKGEFEDYIWFDGSELTETSVLSDIKKERLGQPTNLIGSFCSHKTLLVIDNLNFKITSNFINGCETGFSLGSSIVITSQIQPEVSFFSIPEYSDEELLRIVGCYSDLAKSFVQKIKLPVVLNTIKTSSHYNTEEIEVLLEEILNDPSSATDINAKNILAKILNKLDDKDALIKMCNTGIKKWDISILKKYIKVQKYKNLETLSLLQVNEISKTTHIHDFIYECMRNKNDIDLYMNFLTEEIHKLNGFIDDSLLRQIHLCYSDIENYCLSQKPIKNNWLTYGFLQVESERKELIASKLWDTQFSCISTLEEVRSLIDAKEAKLFVSQKKEEVAQQFLSELLEAKTQFEDNPEIKLIILHHIGKCYRRMKNYDDSMIFLNEALRIKNDFYPTHLQIAKCSVQEKTNKYRAKGEQSIKLILDDIFSRKNIPFRISLSAISDLRSFRSLYDSLNETDIEFLKQIISMASFEGLQQYYEAFVSFISMFSWKHPEICILLFNENKKFLILSPEQQKKNQWANICGSLTNIYPSFKGTDTGHRISQLLLQYSKVIANEFKNLDYEIRAVAKALCFLEKYEEVIALVDGFENPSHFMLRWKCIAELKSGSKECLKTSEQIILLNEQDGKSKSFLSSNYELHSDCLQFFGDEDTCKVYLKKAIDSCSDFKYKEQLQDKLKKL